MARSARHRAPRTGTALRRRKAGAAAVTDPDSESKKS